MSAWTLADLRYDAETHTTTLPDGTDVPHVTHVLSAVGVATDFGELSHLSRKTAMDIAFARDRGIAVHADCHAYDDNDIVWASVADSIRPYLYAWIRLREDLRLIPLRRERRVWHPLYVYTGIEDGVFRIEGTDCRPLIDIKTGDPEDSACHLQTAAYDEADRLAHPEEPATERWAVWLKPRDRVPYKIINHSNRPDAYMDFQKFLACLTVYHEQPERRRRVA